jgi:hypothetical protein
MGRRLLGREPAATRRRAGIGVCTGCLLGAHGIASRVGRCPGGPGPGQRTAPTGRLRRLGRHRAHHAWYLMALTGRRDRWMTCVRRPATPCSGWSGVRRDQPVAALTDGRPGPWLSAVGWFGATDDERRRPMPGDELLDAPLLQLTYGITIDAPPDRVWPWLMQTGQGQAGFYADAPWWDRCVDLYYRLLSRERAAPSATPRGSAGRRAGDPAAPRGPRTVEIPAGLRSRTSTQVPTRITLGWPGRHHRPAGLHRRVARQGPSSGLATGTCGGPRVWDGAVDPGRWLRASRRWPPALWPASGVR